MHQIKKILSEYNIKPSKKLGQNFLVNQTIAKKIALFVCQQPFNKMVEIGPGLGAITEQIDKQFSNYYAIEFDYRLFEFLTTKFQSQTKIDFIRDDFLQWQEDQYFGLNDEVLLFGNIPYVISSPIIKKFLNCSFYKVAVLMVEKIYYDRLVSFPNNKNYTSLSVFVQTFCDLKKLFEVNFEQFEPKPTITSVVFWVQKKVTEQILVSQINAYSKFINVCFGMKRKTIFNNLKVLFHDKDVLTTFLKSCDIKINQRPETISVDQYIFMFKKFTNQN